MPAPWQCQPGQRHFYDGGGHKAAAATLFMHCACGNLSLWDKSSVARANAQPNPRWWPIFALSCISKGLLWSIGAADASGTR